MKIGCIFVSYGMVDYLSRSLGPWINFRKNHDIKIAAVSLPFKDCEIQNDGTQDLLKKHLDIGEIDYLFTQPTFLSEWEARDLALQALLKDGCEMVVLADGDEFPSIEQNILPSLVFIAYQPFIAWFKSCYKNYIWDERHYLAEPFAPPRWYRTKVSGFTLSHFTGDNDISYLDPQGNQRSHLMLPRMTIPKEISWISHLTWLDNTRSRNKILYHQNRWGKETGCSYRWNEEKNCVEFNLDYYRKTGQNVPEVREEI